MKKIELQTGTLYLENINKKDINLESLIGFGSRANKKRGFLFVSKVLGKHIPSKPSSMEKVCITLANKLQQELNEKPTIVIGFAETATGIGHGVYQNLNIKDSFYLHTTRYNISSKKLLEFKEEHSHAPSHILYDIENPELKKISDIAENIVLIDDEISTGKTIENIVKQLKKTFPNVKNYFACSIISWINKPIENIKFISLYNGNFSFESKDYEIPENILSETKDYTYLDEVIPYNFGRQGIQEFTIDYEDYIDLESLENKKVLVLGTGEFMYSAFLIGKYLEKNNIDVYVQSTTRSPVNVEMDIKSKIRFKDNYYENIDNFLYNVIDKNYDKVFICYETTSIPPNHNLKDLLKQHIQDVEELFIKPHYSN